MIGPLSLQLFHGFIARGQPFSVFYSVFDVGVQRSNFRQRPQCEYVLLTCLPYRAP